MAQRWVVALAGMATAAALVACGALGEAGGTSPGATAPVAPAETVVAPNGDVLTRCGWADAATTATVDGRLVTWSCPAGEAGEEVVLSGEVILAEEGWAITRTVVRGGDGAGRPETSEQVIVAGMELADGEVCFSAGTGATAGYQEQRLNYTCGARASDGTFTALFGELTATEEGYRILRATGRITEQGFQAEASDTPGVAALLIEG